MTELAIFILDLASAWGLLERGEVWLVRVPLFMSDVEEGPAPAKRSRGIRGGASARRKKTNACIEHQLQVGRDPYPA